MPKEGYPIVKINANLSEKEVAKNALNDIIIINKDKGKEIDER